MVYRGPLRDVPSHSVSAHFAKTRMHASQPRTVYRYRPLRARASRCVTLFFGARLLPVAVPAPLPMLRLLAAPAAAALLLLLLPVRADYLLTQTYNNLICDGPPRLAIGSECSRQPGALRRAPCCRRQPYIPVPPTPRTQTHSAATTLLCFSAASRTVQRGRSPFLRSLQRSGAATTRHTSSASYTQTVTGALTAPTTLIRRRFSSRCPAARSFRARALRSTQPASRKAATSSAAARTPHSTRTLRASSRRTATHPVAPALPQRCARSTSWMAALTRKVAAAPAAIPF